MDGRSLMPPLSSQDSRSRSFIVESARCRFRGVRRDHQVYLEHRKTTAEGLCREPEIEHYDLDLDPYQVDSAYPAEPGTKQKDFQGEARRMLVELADCAGIRGRDPQPRSGHYCD